MTADQLQAFRRELAEAFIDAQMATVDDELAALCGNTVPLYNPGATCTWCAAKVPVWGNRDGYATCPSCGQIN